MPKVTKKTVKKAVTKATKKVAKEKAAFTKTAKDLIDEGRKKLADIQGRPVWGKVRQGLEDAAGAVGRTAEKATEQAVTMAKRAGTEYKIFEQERELQKQLAELGRKVHNAAKANPGIGETLGPDIRALIDMIKKTEEKIAELHAQAAALKK